MSVIWSNLKVKSKLMVMAAGFCCAILVVGATGLINMKRIDVGVGKVNDSLNHVAVTSEMKANFLQMRLDLVYMLSLTDPDKLAAKADDFSKRTALVKDALAKMEREHLDAKEAALISSFKEGFDAYLEQGTKLIDMAKSAAAAGGGREEVVSFATGSVAPLYEKPASAVAELVSYNVNGGAQIYSDSERTYGTSFSITLLVIVLVALGSVLAGIIIANSISRPLNRVFDILCKVAAGDLTARSDIDSRDEMGMLAREVNVMGEKIHSIITQVAHNTGEVSAAAVQLYKAAEQIATGAEELAGQADTVATAGEEMAATSGEIAENCTMVASSSKRANDTATNGASVVSETVAVMGRIAERVKEAARTVETLGSRSDQIGQIVGTIEDIADQTNLLALNAAIEAARAGEQGRGFAVVADEVRALAERTTRATREISEMIKAIQVETRGAVGSMEEGVNEVERGTSEAARSGEALQEILDQINAVSMQVSQIATAAEQQTATTNEISKNMQQITEVVQVTARGSHESAVAANQLAGLAEGLEKLVAQFKIAA